MRSIKSCFLPEVADEVDAAAAVVVAAVVVALHRFLTLRLVVDAEAEAVSRHPSLLPDILHEEGVLEEAVGDAVSLKEAEGVVEGVLCKSFLQVPQFLTLVFRQTSSLRSRTRSLH